LNHFAHTETHNAPMYQILAKSYNSLLSYWSFNKSFGQFSGGDIPTLYTQSWGDQTVPDLGKT